MTLDFHALLDDLIALASVRGDSATQQRWTWLRDALTRHDSGDTPLAAEVREAVDHATHEGWVLRETAIAELPVDLRWLFEAHAVTVAQLEPLVGTLGVLTLADLHTAVHKHAVRDAAGLGPAVEASIVRALPTLRSKVPRFGIGRGLAAAEPLIARLVAQPHVQWAEVTGSPRRGLDLIGDIDIVVSADDADDTFTPAMAGADIDRVAHRSRHQLAVTVGTTQVTVRTAPRDRAAARLLWTTGSRAHVARLQQIAHSRDMTLTPDGLVDASGRHRGGDSEAAIYAALGLPWIPPELRDDDTIIDRARAGALPDLVERNDILGDLHTHTSWSDGRDSIDAMVRGAVDLGYRFIAITDHSPSSTAVRNLTTENVSQQAEEIARARELFPQITILHGCEVDILPDGHLDFSDKMLRRFDIVLASLHNRAGHSSQQLLRRYLAAMVHPLVTIVTHPTNRLFPRQAGYDLDYNRLFEAAIETRTVLEIDGAPSHIDLDATLAGRAAAMGVTLSIDSDAHASNQLERHMRIGLLTARRGGVERRHVLNSRPLPEIRAIIASKRSRSPA